MPLEKTVALPGSAQRLDDTRIPHQAPQVRHPPTLRRRTSLKLLNDQRDSINRPQRCEAIKRPPIELTLLFFGGESPEQPNSSPVPQFPERSNRSNSNIPHWILEHGDKRIDDSVLMEFP
jgi:hypothetical protein